MKYQNILIFIPTYNEKNNVNLIYGKIRSLIKDIDILFLDDASPDGTGKILDDISKKDQKVTVIHRNSKNKGIGSAHIEGINFAYSKSYDYLITMDCDLSHSPEFIIKFIEIKNNADVVVGTRFQNNNSIEDWNLYRKLLTKLGHLASVIFLGLPYDTTGAFRLYNLNKIDKSFLNLIKYKRYSFFFESLYILSYNKYKIVEIPITLPSRVYGESKQKFSDVFLGIRNLFSIFISRIIFSKKYKIK